MTDGDNKVAYLCDVLQNFCVYDLSSSGCVLQVKFFFSSRNI